MEHAQKIEAGARANASFGSEARGAFVSAKAPFSSASGYAASTLSSDDYAIAWNGDGSRAMSDAYTSHGPGTINLNPVGGLSGIYVGERPLSEIVADEIRKGIESGVASYVRRFAAQLVQTELAIVRISDRLGRICDEMDEIRKSIPRKTSQLANDTKFVTSWSIGNGKLRFVRGGAVVAEFGANQAKDLSVSLD